MQQKNQFLLLAQRILLLMALYTLCRLLFLIFNFSYFKGSSISHILSLFFFGLRFDITAIVISNLLFIALSVLPFPFFYSPSQSDVAKRGHKVYQGLLKFIFILVNSIALLFNTIDLEFFKFQGKRATSDGFKIMSFGEDFTNTIPQIASDFWYLLLIFGVLVFILVKIYNKTKYTVLSTKPKVSGTSNFVLNTLYLILCTALCFVGFRGGLQYRPIDIMTASQYASGEEAALVLNTPFTIIKTLEKNVIRPLHYFTQEESEKISPTIHNQNVALPRTANDEPTTSFRPLNVIIIILEGVGKEYIGSLNKNEGYTPFLDSLIKQSFVFTRAFANGKRSIEGIPCIVAGLPALMPEPFITSAYNGNKVTSLASILKSKGYISMFFHGGTNGTMGFDNFCKSAGFDSYYGRREYNNDNDFDGSWGIYDEPFLQYTLQKLNQSANPFLATVFTLSSHHPYAVPEKYKGTFKKGSLPIHESIRYADYSLKRFFETATKMPWFDSTLFVITSDHTALSEHPFYQNRVGMYSVPIIYYMPHDSLIGKSEITTQQIDILPTVLDYLHYDEPYFAFGKSCLYKEEALNSTVKPEGFAVNYINDTYQIIAGDYSYTMDTVKAYSLYNYVNDTLLRNDLLNELPEEKQLLERKLKAFLQNYNNTILNNSMSVNKQ